MGRAALPVTRPHLNVRGGGLNGRSNVLRQISQVSYAALSTFLFSECLSQDLTFFVRLTKSRTSRKEYGNLAFSRS